MRLSGNFIVPGMVARSCPLPGHPKSQEFLLTPCPCQCHQRCPCHWGGHIRFLGAPIPFLVCPFPSRPSRRRGQKTPEPLGERSGASERHPWNLHPDLLVLERLPGYSWHPGILESAPAARAGTRGQPGRGQVTLCHPQDIPGGTLWIGKGRWKRLALVLYFILLFYYFISPPLAFSFSSSFPTFPRALGCCDSLAPERSRLCPSPGKQFLPSPRSVRAGAPSPSPLQADQKRQDVLGDIFITRNLNKKWQPWAQRGDLRPSLCPSVPRGQPRPFPGALRGREDPAGSPGIAPCASSRDSPASRGSLATSPHLPWPRALSPCPPGPGSRRGCVRDGLSHSLAPAAAAAGVDPFIVWEGAGPAAGQGGKILAGENTPGLLRRARLGGRETGTEGGRQPGDAKRGPPRERVLSAASAGQNSVLPPLKPGFASLGMSRR